MAHKATEVLGGRIVGSAGIWLGSMRWVIPLYVPYRSGRSFSHSAQPCPAPPIPPAVTACRPPHRGVYSERDAHHRRAADRVRLLIICSSFIPIYFLHLCPRHSYPKFHLEGVLTFCSVADLRSTPGLELVLTHESLIRTRSGRLPSFLRHQATDASNEMQGIQSTSPLEGELLKVVRTDFDMDKSRPLKYILTLSDTVKNVMSATFSTETFIGDGRKH
ncbi:hypothetical protein C8Q74DRAFT_875414 [Fomes fomentarius]|nr:hypothetical protein C8Q74DRAFT_875414 [Fomes fomentarius]